MSKESFKNIIEGLALRADELGQGPLRLELDHKHSLRQNADGRLREELNWIRLWTKIEIGKRSDCWNWMKAISQNGGYGVFKPLFRNQRGAHRMVYELWFGEIPEGMDVLHKCDNPPCCNPRHLFLGTNLDNIRDKVQKRRQTMGEDVNTALLTRDTVASILEEFCVLYAGRWDQVTCFTWKQIALKYPPASRHMVRNIILRNVWSCVPRPPELERALPFLRQVFIRKGRPVSGLSGSRQGMKSLPA